MKIFDGVAALRPTRTARSPNLKDAAETGRSNLSGRRSEARRGRNPKGLAAPAAASTTVRKDVSILCKRRSTAALGTIPLRPDFQRRDRNGAARFEIIDKSLPAVLTQRDDVVENVVSGRKTAAQMARLYQVSQPTISRILAATRVAVSGPRDWKPDTFS